MSTVPVTRDADERRLRHLEGEAPDAAAGAQRLAARDRALGEDADAGAGAQAGRSPLEGVGVSGAALDRYLAHPVRGSGASRPIFHRLAFASARICRRCGRRCRSRPGPSGLSWLPTSSVGPERGMCSRPRPRAAPPAHERRADGHHEPVGAGDGLGGGCLHRVWSLTAWRRGWSPDRIGLREDSSLRRSTGPGTRSRSRSSSRSPPTRPASMRLGLGGLGPGRRLGPRGPRRSHRADRDRLGADADPGPPTDGRGDGGGDDRRDLRRPDATRARALGPAGLGGLVRGPVRAPAGADPRVRRDRPHGLGARARRPRGPQLPAPLRRAGWASASRSS